MTSYLITFIAGGVASYIIQLWIQEKEEAACQRDWNQR